MSLVTGLGNWLDKRLGRAPALSRDEALGLRPIRNSLVTWERRAKPDAGEAECAEPGLVMITVPRKSGALTGVLARLLQAPDARKIELDEFGSAIWEQCDGKHSVDELARYTSSTYKLNRRQAEVSVIAFMKMLSQRRLIGFVEAKGQGTGGRIREAERPAGQVDERRDPSDGSTNSKQRTAKGRGRKRRF